MTAASAAGRSVLTLEGLTAADRHLFSRAFALAADRSQSMKVVLSFE